MPARVRRALAEQAEQENAGAEERHRLHVESLERTLANEREARSRAEADNAALVRNIHVYHDAWKSGRDTLALVELLRSAKTPHPGAAMLEIRSAAIDALECMDEDWPDRPATIRLRNALRGKG